VQNICAGRIVGPDDLPALLLEANQARSFGVGHGDMIPVDTMARVDVNPFFVQGHGTGASPAHRRRMRKDTEILHEIEFPMFDRFAFAAQQRADIKANDIGTGCGEPNSLVLSQGSAFHAGVLPVVAHA
jgi:hypothetical protein